MRHAYALLALALAPLALAACPAVPVRPPPPPRAKAPPAPPPKAAPAPGPRDPFSLLTPCLPKHATPEALQAAMDRAFDHHDARCWSAAEIALARSILDGAHGDGDALQQAAWHFRQASLRATAHAMDDLAAVAELGEARVAMAAGDRKATVFHLDRATDAADLDAAATGRARIALDAIYVRSIIESLAAWETGHDDALASDALSAATRLQAREALRAFAKRGIGPADLAGAANDADARSALGALALRSTDLRGAWGERQREMAPRRAEAAEAVVDTGPAWMAAAPALLDWLPGDLPDTVGTTRAVLTQGEVLLDYAVGEHAGALLVVTSDRFTARPIPGREALGPMIAACVNGACDDLAKAVLAPAGDALASARQVLVAAHGPLHRAPFARLLAGKNVVRVPSAIALAGLRLRAWGQGPKAHPTAATLVPLAERARAAAAEGAPPTVAAGHAPGALAPLRAALAAGASEVEWTGGAAARAYGVPLTIPGAPEPATPAPEAAKPAPKPAPAAPSKPAPAAPSKPAPAPPKRPD